MKELKQKSLIFIIIAILFLLFSSCLGSKKTTEKTSNTKIENSSKTEKDSSVVKEKNNAIEDRITINVPKTDNKELMEMFNNAMRQLNTSKTSGTNSYTSVFDEELMKWIIEFKIGETINKDTNVNNNSETKNSEKIITEETFKKTVSQIPWWGWAILIIWLLPSIIEKIMFFINPIKSIITKINEK